MTDCSPDMTLITSMTTPAAMGGDPNNNFVDSYLDQICTDPTAIMDGSDIGGPATKWCSNLLSNDEISKMQASINSALSQINTIKTNLNI